MPRSFKFELPADWRARLSKDPRVIARAGLGVLLLANLVAAYAVFQPIGGSAEELEEQISQMQSQIQARQAALQRMRGLVAKIEKARASGDEFLVQYFMNRRAASSAIVQELNQAAKDAGIRPKEHSYAWDPIEGSDTLTMMTITANYEGTYGDLLEFVNKLDKSPRFLILDSLVAAPQQGGGALNFSVKLNTFVKDDAPALAAGASL
jgi:type IV pilus assembly protein PilO